MTVVTYAQNFEDIMLWRALKDVPSGFYIDIGANDPYTDSATKLFYENGWHGINVEPLSHHYKQLVESRPRDINIKAAIGNKKGSLDIWEPEVRGWATASKAVIKQHQKKGVSGKTTRVEQKTLAALCEEHVSGEIHFLKIDVEGLEKAVLEGADFERFRPWILVIEATEPDSTQENFETWESIVTEANYQLVYCDGLNRFYLANEKSDLASFFRYPPNVFDDFCAARIPYLESLLIKTQQECDARIHEMSEHFNKEEERFAATISEKEKLLESQSSLIESKRSLLESKSTLLESEIYAHKLSKVDLEWERNTRIAMEDSLSWKLTQPLRLFKLFIMSSILPFIKVLLRPIARMTIRFTKKHSGIRMFATRILNRFPRVKSRVASFMAHNSLGGPIVNVEYRHNGSFGPLDEPESSRKHVENALDLSDTERFLKSEL